MFVKDKYENYRNHLISYGAGAEEIEAAIDDMKSVDAKIDAGTCPKCDSKITRTIDPRQSGATEIAGKWFNYRCVGSCGWFADRCEPVGEN